MNKEELIRAIQRVGMGTFVKYFEAFSDESKKSDDLIESLIQIESYGKDSARTKVNSARRIIGCNLSQDALQVISDSQNTDSWVAPKATFLMEQYES